MRFPKMHIATSVVNRILNTHDQLRSRRLAETFAAARASDLVHRGPTPATSLDAPERGPAVPDPSAEGAALETALAAMQPTGANAPAVPLAVAQGGSPLDGLLAQQA